MRRLILVSMIVVVVGAATWALWPGTRWPQSFCGPVVRAVGADANAIAKSFAQPAPTLTAIQRHMVVTLRHDVGLAASAAPTARLRAELSRYLTELSGQPSMLTVSDAFSQFDAVANKQLQACGVHPL